MTRPVSYKLGSLAGLPRTHRKPCVIIFIRSYLFRLSATHLMFIYVRDDHELKTSGNHRDSFIKMCFTNLSFMSKLSNVGGDCLISPSNWSTDSISEYDFDTLSDMGYVFNLKCWYYIVFITLITKVLLLQKIIMNNVDFVEISIFYILCSCLDFVEISIFWIFFLLQYTELF